MRYKWDEKRKTFVDRDGKRMLPKKREWKPVTPTVISDIPAYRSPLSWKPVDGRYQRREEMKRHNVREVEPDEKYSISNIRNKDA